ncbi:MAG: hypothetical protein ACP5Q5_10150 [Brevinematia bacterium]
MEKRTKIKHIDYKGTAIEIFEIKNEKTEEIHYELVSSSPVSSTKTFNTLSEAEMEVERIKGEIDKIAEMKKSFFQERTIEKGGGLKM